MAAALARAITCSPCFAAAAVAQHALLHVTVRVTVVSELTKPEVHTTTSICLKECGVSWQFRQTPWFSRAAAARAVGESRPLHGGGSSVEELPLVAQT